MNVLKELNHNCFYAVHNSIKDKVTADNYWDWVSYGTNYQGTADLSMLGFGEVEFNCNPRLIKPIYGSYYSEYLFGHTSSKFADMVAEFLTQHGFDTYTEKENTIQIKFSHKINIEIPVYGYGCGRYVMVSMDMKDFVKDQYGNMKLRAVLVNEAKKKDFPYGLKKNFMRILTAKTQIDAAVALLIFNLQLTEITNYQLKRLNRNYKSL